MTLLPGFFVVIPAGGAGKRLWPLSRPDRPKFLLDLTGAGRTLIQQTWDRLAPLAGDGQVEVVTGRDHAAAVAAQLPGLTPANLIVEPGPRDSMPAIALAAAITRRRHGDVVLGSFAADHIIHGQERFARAVELAYLAAQEGFIATIGIQPSGPSTAYGYIKAGRPLGLVGAPELGLVEAFKEKPDRATARAYLESGGYRWNAGMFVFKVNLLLDQLARLHPRLADGIGQIAEAWDSGERDEVAQEVWPQITGIAFDHAMAEPVAGEGGLATAPGDFAWSDVGDFASLADLLEPGPDGARRLILDGGPEPLLIDAPGTLAVSAAGRTVAVLGLPEAVVVDTPGAVLVTTRDRAQDVKALVEALSARGGCRV
ncbi:MAG: mannose-1-phosphate guanylyltransferase [Bifidobacteriaceae bacterium]|jgi:mannose-1-phosphate guanylyltransferase|nr:mannose-1-phosphate guanylyltransferase [Bifidobacteriaceae bacterium]